MVNWSKTPWGHNKAEAEQAREAVLWFGLIGLACTAATLANPYGIDLHRHLFWYLFSPSSVTGHVTEWLSPDFRNPRLYWFELLVPICAAAGLWTGLRREMASCVLTLGGLQFALLSVRNIPICAILSAAPIAKLIEETVQRTTGSGSDKRRQWSFSISDGCAVTLVIAGLLVLTQHSRGSLRLAPESSPTVTAVARLPRGRLFTTDSWADYLIYTSPGRRVFFDCRSDMYGPDLVHQYLWITEAKPGWKDLLMSYGIAVALVPKASAISAALASSVEWRLLFADGTAVVFVRSECEVSACN